MLNWLQLNERVDRATQSPHLSADTIRSATKGRLSHYAYLFLPILFSHLFCSDAVGKEVTYRSISVADSGNLVILVQASGPDASLLRMFERGVSQSKDYRLSSAWIEEAIFSNDASKIYFTAMNIDSKSNEYKQWSLYEMPLSEFGKPVLLDRAPGKISSMWELTTSELIYLRGYARLPPRQRSIAHWVRRQKTGNIQQLSDRVYGYGVTTTVVSDSSLAFLDAVVVDGVTEQRIEHFSFTPGYAIKPLPITTLPKRTQDFGCDRHGSICFTAETVDVPGRSFFHAKLRMHWSGGGCTVSLRGDWKPVMHLSGNGAYIALVEQKLDNARNITKTEVNVLRLSRDACTTLVTSIVI